MRKYLAADMERMLDNVRKYGNKDPDARKATCPLCNDGCYGIVFTVRAGEPAGPECFRGSCAVGHHTPEQIWEAVRERLDEHYRKKYGIKPEPAGQNLPAARKEEALTEMEAAGEIQTRQQIAEMAEWMRKLAEGNRSLAEMLRVTNERMEAMEKVIRTLEKVSPQQAGNISKAIRERAAELCREYLMGVRITPVAPGKGSEPEKARFEPNAEKEKALRAGIRNAVRDLTGARSMREIARCDYDSVIAFVMDWDDYEIIQRIRKAGK